MSAFVLANAGLIATQAALVALPGRGVPETVRRLRRGAGPFVPIGCVVAIVVAGSLGSHLSVALTWLALLSVPPLAAAALGWAVRGSRPAAALLVVPPLLLAACRVGELDGDAAAAALTALSCVTLGRLLAGAVPRAWLIAGVAVFAIYDVIAVFTDPHMSPDAAVNAAMPGPGLAQLQVLDLHAARMSYADVFLAALIGGLLAVEGRRQWPIALLVLVISILFDVLFVAFSTLPATVPVAAALFLRGVGLRRAK
jgi:hypothetical protein